jgi:hypothetical protein
MEEDDNIVIPNLGKKHPPIIVNNKVVNRSDILENRRGKVTSPNYPIETVKYDPINVFDDTSPSSPPRSQRKPLLVSEEVSLPSSVKRKKKITPSSPPPLAIPPECKLEIPVPKTKSIGIIQKEIPPSPVTHVEDKDREREKDREKKDYKSMSEDEQYRIRMSFEEKFRIIRNAYREMEFPNITDDMSLDRISDIYQQQINRIILSQSCTQYKCYLIIFLIGMEYVCCNYLKLNASGFAMSQFRLMYRYEHLLAELGENSHLKAMASWPPEIRLFLTIAFNMIFFIALKHGGGKLGLNEQKINDVYDGIGKMGGLSENRKVDENGIPEPPMDPMAQIGGVVSSFMNGNKGGGFDLNGIMSQVSGFFGGNKEMSKEEKEKCKSVPVSHPKTKKDVKW